MAKQFTLYLCKIGKKKRKGQKRFNNKSVFKESYTIDPEEEISSPKINAELGQYRYEIILDNKFSFEQKIQAYYATDVSSSEALYIYISDDPENPVTFGITVA